MHRGPLVKMGLVGQSGDIEKLADQVFWRS